MKLSTHTTPSERAALRDTLSYLCWGVQALARHAALTQPHLALGTAESVDDIANLLYAALATEERLEAQAARDQGGRDHAC